MKKDVIDYLVTAMGLTMEDTPELYESFIGSFADCVGDLRAMPDYTDFMAIRRVTHTLIGFSQNVGAQDLFEAARALNLCAKAEDSDGCARAAQAIFDLYAAYRAEN